MPPSGAYTEGCWAATPVVRSAAKAHARAAHFRMSAHQGELREPHDVVGLPRPDERHVARSRMRADADVILAVVFERDAPEERKLLELVRQPRPGHILAVGEIR